MSSDCIIFEDVSKFYGEVLGVNHVTLSLPPGITSMVGPNGSGKTTLMNLMTGLIQPTRGRISLLGMTPADPAALFRTVGYCTQFDSFPRSVTGFEFIYEMLLLHGLSHEQAVQLTSEALQRVGLADSAHRQVAGYSKGMRQKIRLAQALAHHPSVLVLDEPLNGLDPMARAETMALFETLGRQGMHVIISSHILEEVDRISDRVVLMTNGYIVAEGNIHAVRQEVREQPMQILVRCTEPSLLASKVFALNHAVEAKLHTDGGGLLVRTRDLDQFYGLLNRIAAEGLVQIEAVAPADDDVNSIYQYLIGSDGGQS
jgi:ABC-2 type transport system ATP-binding protein